jgi:hypothetical protein
MYLCAKTSAALCVVLFCGLLAFAQDQTPASAPLIAFSRAAVPVVTSNGFLPEAPSPHKFWDARNRFLFSAVAAFSAADFSVTHNNLANGGRELNPIVRPFAGNSATLALNFAGQTAGVMGISYLFHKTGHHRLERIAPLANIASSAFAVSYGLAHR